jgi:hypothetical protein
MNKIEKKMKLLLSATIYRIEKEMQTSYAAVGRFEE